MLKKGFLQHPNQNEKLKKKTHSLKHKKLLFTVAEIKTFLIVGQGEHEQSPFK
jgi:hypothetical protein